MIKKRRLRYRRTVITLECDKPEICQCCEKQRNKIDLHHIKYEFSTAEVRKNPELILKNTLWLCFHCHMIADAIRKIDEQPELYNKLVWLKFKSEVTKLS